MTVSMPSRIVTALDEPGLQVAGTKAPGGRRADEQPATHRDRRCEEDDPRVERHLVQARDVRWCKQHDGPHDDRRNQNSCRSADDAKDKVFDEHLPNQAPSSGADRRAHGDFPAAREHARRQEVGRVDTPDQQHYGRGREEQHEHRPRTARQLRLQRHCPGIQPGLAGDGMQQLRLRAIEILLRPNEGHAWRKPRERRVVVPADSRPFPGSERQRFPCLNDHLGHRYRIQVPDVWCPEAGTHDSDDRCGAPSSAIVRPTIEGSAPNRRLHNPSLNTTTASAPGCASLSVNRRPTRTVAPSIGSSAGDTRPISSLSGSPAPVRFMNATFTSEMCSNDVVCSDQNSASAALAGNGPKVGSPSWMTTRRSGSGYERLRNATTSSTLKMPAVPPMPMASVRTAAMANDGLRRNCLKAKTTSCPSDSISGNPCSSRADSLTRSTLPNSRLALARASRSVSPCGAELGGEHVEVTVDLLCERGIAMRPLRQQPDTTDERPNGAHGRCSSRRVTMATVLVHISISAASCFRPDLVIE